jgi:hypothetical protein
MSRSRIKVKNARSTIRKHRDAKSRDTRQVSAVTVTDTTHPEVDARRRLTQYLLGVIENPKADPRRRDDSAYSLAKILATATPRVISQKAPGKPNDPPKARVSTYVSKKKQADVSSKTAHNGSPWEGLVNGGEQPPGDDDDEDEDEAATPGARA